jgi:peroxiredoxin
MITRRRVIAAAIGAAVGLLCVGAVIAMTRDDSDVDGTFVLDKPGVYSEPVATTNIAGKALPDVELTDPEGRPVAMQSFAGEPLVVNVWYSTCAPCARELRDFADVSADLGDRVQFVGIDPVDDVDKMLAFADARGVQYPLLRDTEGRFVSDVAVTAYPTTLFISPDGRIVHQTNAISADDLRSEIADVFGVSG